MSSIPYKANKFGAERLNQFPVSYGKIRVSGSDKASYFLHSKGSCMPGQINLFVPSSLSKPNLSDPLSNNLIQNCFRREKEKEQRKPIGPKYGKDNLENFTYNNYHPYDDSSLENTIIAAYKQIFGNFIPMESEEPVEAKRRLRNGDINVREFIRILSKSEFYRKHYFEKVNQLKVIQLNFKHILGRPIFNELEKIKNIELINSEGFYGHIDSLIDSSEYNELFGENVVPYMRCWNSPSNSKTSSFIQTILLTQSFATSDHIIINSKQHFREITSQ